MPPFHSAAPSPTGHRVVAGLFRLLCLAPAAWYLLFVAFVLRARLALGRWPEPYHPDPKALGFGLHHWAINLGIPLICALPVLLVGLVVGLRGSKELLPPNPWRWLAVYALAFAGSLLLARHDPGAFWNWFAD